jgi:plastocyanin
MRARKDCWMRPHFLLFVLALAAAAAPAFAGSVRVHVRNEAGRPVADAVVLIHTATPHTGPITFPWPMRIAQRDMRFDPFVLIAPTGASVAFPNYDSLRHHVYSFSPAGPFELRLYSRDESRSVRFQNNGVIAIGCNIHDSMSAFIYVVDTPYAAKTNAAGEVTLDNVPAGAAQLHFWHPYQRTPDNVVDRAVAIPRSGTLEQNFVMRLRARPDRASSY